MIEIIKINRAEYEKLHEIIPDDFCAVHTSLIVQLLKESEELALIKANEKIMRGKKKNDRGTDNKNRLA